MMDPSTRERVARAANGADRAATIAVLRADLGWPREDVAAFARGLDADVAERARAAVADLAARALAERPAGDVPRRAGLPPVDPAVVGDHDARAVEQLRRCLDHDDALAGALCADGHRGYSQPVGAAVAFGEHVSVSGVGFDIGCGNLAVRLGMPWGDLRARGVGAAADEIARRVPFGLGRTPDVAGDHPLFEDDEAWRRAGPAAVALRDAARAQLGSVGAGNHYVDVFREAPLAADRAASPEADDAASVWIGVHFGSRGLGHRLATHFLRRAGGRDGIDARPTLVHQDTDLGREYIAAMELAGRYAAAGRERAVEAVARILGGPAILDRVHNHHNFAWRESHGGRDAWVVRKGCTPAFPGQRGFVGGSMGDDAVILEGAEHPLAEGLLRSTVHGAGRVFGRQEARRRFGRAEMDAWLARRGVELRGGDIDESPMAYRRLDEVLARHAGTVRVLHRLRPVIVAMAGPGDVDPYKD